MVVVGEVSGVYGVQGWIRVFSHTDPRDNILGLTPWYVGGVGHWTEHAVLGGRRQGKGVVARLAGCEDRDRAAALIGRQIAVRRDQLPPPAEDEFYWTDLEGLRVVDAEGRDLGVIDHLFATGANDVMVVLGERERLIPFVWDAVIKEVAFEAGQVRVDWDPEF